MNLILLLTYLFVLPSFASDSTLTQEPQKSFRQAVSQAIISTVPQLHPEQQKRDKLSKIKKQLPADLVQGLRKKLKQDASNCYANRKAFDEFINNQVAFTQDIFFGSDCNIEGSLSYKLNTLQIDFSLKDLSPFYRLQMLLKFELRKSPSTDIQALRVKIYDGKIFHTKDDIVPYAKFVGTTDVILNKKSKFLRTENTGLQTSTWAWKDSIQKIDLNF